MNRRAFLLGAAMVLLANLVAVALRSYAEAAFIAGYGKSALPWLLIASAGGFAGVTIAYDQLARRARGTGADLVLLGVLLVVTAISPTLLDAGAPPVLVVIATAAAPQVAGSRCGIAWPRRSRDATRAACRRAPVRPSPRAA